MPLFRKAYLKKRAMAEPDRTNPVEDLHLASRPEDLWSVHRASSPLVGTAIHNGSHVRPALLDIMRLDAGGRLREEDPYTEAFIRDVPNRVVFHRSRFEIDLNRAREGAFYIAPEQAWGLDIWRERPHMSEVEKSLGVHAAYYAMLGEMLSGIEAEFGQFVLLDVHSYNHRRTGRNATPTATMEAPVINIGTISMDRARWAHILDPFIDCLRSFEFGGAPLDVRENVAFQGRGEQTRFVHHAFPQSGCAIAIEFKKVFMDEWTGEPDVETIEFFRQAIRSSLPVLQESLEAHA